MSNVDMRRINNKNSDTSNNYNNSSSNTSSKYYNYNHYYVIFYLFIISTCIKILVVPIYKSTDYNVHLQWKSITYTKNNIPMYNWYYDNTYVNTIHTVDYPPSFILFFECIWSNIYYPLLQFIINNIQQIQQGNVSTTGTNSFDTCLNLYSDDDLLPTSSTIAYNPLYDNQCILFMRSTVIISDIILWIGSYIVSTAVVRTKTNQQNVNSNLPSKQVGVVNFSYILFILLTFNPGLHILDHIHFQYNGFLLGILLCSIGCLLHANNNSNNNNINTSTSTTNNNKLYHLSSAAIFAILISFKHLYITLGLWYASYLFRRYCVTSSKMTSSDVKNIRNYNNKKQLQVQRIYYTNFFQLAIVTITMIIVPFIPFIVSIVYANNNNNKSITTLVGLFNTTTTTTTVTNARPNTIMLIHKFFVQVKDRLFPFQRGLVHDYWAGNIWAIIIALQQYIVPVLVKVLPNNKILLVLKNNNVNDTIQPIYCLVLLFIMLLPSTICAWIAGAGAATATGTATGTSNNNNINNNKNHKLSNDTKDNIRNNSNSLLLLSLSHAAMTTFLFSYHVHEKAIMTAVIPIIIWTIVVSINQLEITTSSNKNTNTSATTPTTTTTTRKDFIIPTSICWTFLWEFTSLAILGLFPLLYESRETLIKVTMYVSYLAAIHYCSLQFTTTILQQQGDDSDISNNKNTTKKKMYNMRLISCIVLISFVIIQLDFIPVQKLYGRYEFLPLAITSIVCSIGFILLYIQMTYYMIQLSRNLL